MLLALEYLRRKPESTLRAVLVFLCSLQLSLTVYTMWVFWVLPTLLAAVWLLPRGVLISSERRSLRNSLVLILVSLVALMAIYTAERWTSLTASAGYGIRLETVASLFAFLDDLAGQLVPIPYVVLPIALLGLAAFGRSHVRWWAWPLLMSVAAPIALGLSNGSFGYARNLAFVLVPVSLCAGLGVHWLLDRPILKYRPVAIAAVMVLALGSTAAYAGYHLERRARTLLLPDWGALTQELDAAPSNEEPRWLLRCLANHWQINWYSAGPDASVLVEPPADGPVEVVLGAQLGADGKPKIYRVDSVRGGIRAFDLPDWLADVPPDDTKHGIALWRWDCRT